MQKKKVSFEFQAPYVKLGELKDTTENLWFIFHGYGQLAEEFQEKFKVLNHEENVLIFPQALSKFYLKGVDKKIGASWMTSHDRELDIENYINYLNQIYQQELVGIRRHVNINILGFSQGGHTASRWIYKSGIGYNKLILWGAGLAYEINEKIICSSFNIGKQYFVIGDQDRFIDQSALDAARKRYEGIGFDYELVGYQGIHDIYPDVLSKIV